MPTISIIIPTYRHGHFVLATLESVWAQTYRDYEVIVVNDGSPDDTAARLAPLAESGRIRYVEQANAGQAAARNLGLELARGEFVAFLDDDDLWPADKLEWQVAALRSDASLGVIGGCCVYFTLSPAPTTEATGCLRQVTLPSLFSGNPFTSPGQTLMRTALVREGGGFDTAIWGADDLDLYMRLVQKARIKLTPDIALFYRRHNTNASRDLKRMLLNSRRVVFKHLHQVAPPLKGGTKRTAYRWLYNYLGVQLLQRAKADLKQGEALSAIEHLLALGWIGPGMLRDPGLAVRFLRDITPLRLRRR